MNIEAIIESVEQSEIQLAETQIRQMETEEVSVLGPMNMLAFDA